MRQWRERISPPLSNWYWVTKYPHAWVKLEYYLLPYTKSSSKWIKVNKRVKAIKFIIKPLEEILRFRAWNLTLIYQMWYQYHRQQKEEVEKLYFIQTKKNKIFCALRDPEEIGKTMYKIWESICKLDIMHKYPECMNIIQLNNIRNSIKKLAEDLNIHLSKYDTQTGNKYV